MGLSFLHELNMFGKAGCMPRKMRYVQSSLTTLVSSFLPMALLPYAHKVIALLDLPSRFTSCMDPFQTKQYEHVKLTDVEERDLLLDMLLHICTASSVFQEVGV